MKQLMIRGLEWVGNSPILPLSIKIYLAQKSRKLRHILPAGVEFTSDKYLGDVKVNIHTIYAIEREMATGKYDPASSAIIRRFVGPDSVAIDVGANVGALTLLLAKIATSGRVLAIEPGPPMCARLMANLKLNPRLEKVVTVCPVGVSDQVGEPLFWAEEDFNRGNARLQQSQGHPVEITTLDHLVESHGLKKLDFIKIDVEGMEYEVIHGALASIEKFRPIIYFETLEPFREIRGFDLYGRIHDLLSPLKYQHFSVFDNGAIQPVPNLDVLHSQNVLAMPMEKARMRV